jgi:hypothetical protein
VTHAAGAVEARLPPRVPFMVRDADRVHVVRVVYGDDGARAGWAGICAFNLFVHQRVLSAYAHRAEVDGPGPADVEWRAWGPRNTRFMEATSHQFATHLKRSVFLFLRVLEKEMEMMSVQVCPRAACGFSGAERQRGRAADMVAPRRGLHLRFLARGRAVRQPHPARGVFVVRRETVPRRESSSSSGGKPGTLVPPSRVRARTSPFFRDDVETRLPCVVAPLDVAQLYLTYMLYAEGVVGMHVRAFLVLGRG